MIRYIPLILVAGLLADIASLIMTGRWIGLAPVLLLVIGGAVAGTTLIRTGGMSVAAAMRQPPRLDTGQSGLAFSGVFRVIAGLLLIVPGFVSDAVGLCLLLPPTQRWIVGFLHVVFGTRQPSMGPIIEAEAVEIDDENPGPPGEGTGRKRLDR